jgi:hypothetical protein
MSTGTDVAAAPLPDDGVDARNAAFWQNLIAAVICIAWNAGFLMLALRLPAGHSRGDVGPGALPVEIAIGGIALSALYLALVLGRRDVGKAAPPAPITRVVALFALFAVCAATAEVVTLSAGLAVAAGLGTLLFAGERAYLRAVVTAAGVWLIAYLVFERFLGLPLP